MARADLLNRLYAKNRSPLEFNFDALWMPSMYHYLTIQDIEQLKYIATSVSLSGKIEKKYKMIDDIMTARGFKKFHSGTNRVVYRYLEDQSFVAKIAVDRVGMGDNPAEFRNQFLLKPFATKCFEVSPCGTVGFFERVQPLTSRKEFEYIAEDVYNLLVTKVIGQYVLEDIGERYFMNYGIRVGFGVVLLDYPYVFELDGNKIHCNRPIIPGTKFPVCDGLIDYDDGFNNLVCTRCGKTFLAKELEADKKNNLIIIKGDGKMAHVRLIDRNTGKVLYDPGMSSDYIKPEEEVRKVTSRLVYNGEEKETPVVKKEVKNVLSNLVHDLVEEEHPEEPEVVEESTNEEYVMTPEQLQRLDSYISTAAEQQEEEQASPDAIAEMFHNVDDHLGRNKKSKKDKFDFYDDEDNYKKKFSKPKYNRNKNVDLSDY